jgi:hypothetical protein
MILDENSDYLRRCGAFTDLRKGLLKHVEGQETRQRLGQLSLKEFELEACRYKDSLPIKEQTW